MPAQQGRRLPSESPPPSTPPPPIPSLAHTRLQEGNCTRSSVGQSVGLRSRRPEVRVLSGAPHYLRSCRVHVDVKRLSGGQGTPKSIAGCRGSSTGRPFSNRQTSICPKSEKIGRAHV